jgi:uncharacterized cupin superfamily protein
MEDKTTSPLAVVAAEAPDRKRSSILPAPFAARMAGRSKKPLGDLFGLRNFGVNLVRIEPGGVSSLRHSHSRQDEFVYILAGRPTLVTDEGHTPLAPGMCAGFRAGTGNGHCLVNDSAEPALYLEVGDRTPQDVVEYSEDDLRATIGESGVLFTHKDGTPYSSNS